MDTSPRVAYRNPELTNYGSISKLTQVGTSTDGMGGMGGMGIGIMIMIMIMIMIDL